MMKGKSRVKIVALARIKKAAAHGSHGFAQQGNVAVVLERV